MLTGTIVTESNGKGWWIVECDGTSECLFVHHSEVANNRYLHIGDRIKFDSVPNPRKPGQNRAINVTWIARTIARQTSAPAVNYE
jgi:cold shock CspA family protein